jgi:hypothetical protein
VVEEPPRLLPGDRDLELHPVLLQRQRVGDLAGGGLHVAGEPFHLPARNVVAEEDAGGGELGLEGGHDLVAHALHPGGGDLHHELVAEAVHHQPGEAVALAEDGAVERGAEHRVAKRDRAPDPSAQKGAVQGGVAVAAHQARGDQRARVDVSHPHRRAAGVLHLHQVAGLVGGERGGRHVHLVAEHPQVPGT